ncbi:MAG TPA: HutD family protein [Rubrivivax sp.]|nr:HutD family protein [Rubrivivax sp.]
MNLRRISLADCPPQPWRNGSGRTRELLAWPQAGNWQLRVSVADIDHGGPFSPFPGVERWFAVVDGAGVELALPDGAVTVGPGDPPLRFEGEAAPTCRLRQGATRDLNFMHRRGSGVATMQTAGTGSALDGGFTWRALYVADHALLEIDDHTEPLAAGTLIWSDSEDAALWRLRAGGRAWWLTLDLR